MSHITISGKISPRPHTTLCIQLLDKENNDKKFNVLKGPLRLGPLNGAIKLFSVALQVTKQVSLSSSITTLPSRF